MLNRTPETLRTQVEAASPDDDLPREDKLARNGSRSGAAWQFFTHLSMSSLTRRIIFLNVAGLVVLMIGILYLSQFRAGLIDARIQSLMVQGEIIANAVAASGTIDPDGAIIDPQRLLELQLGESYDPSETGSPGLDFPINPVRVAPVLQRLVSPTNTRARIYERDGTFILDSLALYDVLRFDLPPPESSQPNYIERRLMTLRRWLTRGDLPTYRELGQANGKSYEEVAIALTGLKSSMVRINERAEVIVSVAVPVTALPRGARRADAFDPGRRNRRHGHRRAARDAARVPGRGERDGRAVVPARRHDRRPDAAARRIAPKSCAGASRRASRSPTSPTAATRSGICRERCGT